MKRLDIVLAILAAIGAGYSAGVEFGSAQSEPEPVSGSVPQVARASFTGTQPAQPVFLVGEAEPLAPVPAEHSQLRWEVYFSPNGGATDALVRAIDAACSVVMEQDYSFTSRPIAEALVRAHERGVHVQIVLDAGQRTAAGSLGGFCAERGVPVSYDDKHAIAHNKVTIIDHDLVETGSFNKSVPAEKRNAENALFLRGDPALVERYEANFAAHLSHSVAAIVAHPAP